MLVNNFCKLPALGIELLTLGMQDQRSIHYSTMGNSHCSYLSYKPFCCFCLNHMISNSPLIHRVLESAMPLATFKWSIEVLNFMNTPLHCL